MDGLLLALSSPQRSTGNDAGEEHVWLIVPRLPPRPPPHRFSIGSVCVCVCRPNNKKKTPRLIIPELCQPSSSSSSFGGRISPAGPAHLSPTNETPSCATEPKTNRPPTLVSFHTCVCVYSMTPSFFHGTRREIPLAFLFPSGARLTYNRGEEEERVLPVRRGRGCGCGTKPSTTQHRENQDCAASNVGPAWIRHGIGRWGDTSSEERTDCVLDTVSRRRRLGVSSFLRLCTGNNESSQQHQKREDASVKKDVRGGSWHVSYVRLDLWLASETEARLKSSWTDVPDVRERSTSEFRRSHYYHAPRLVPLAK